MSVDTAAETRRSVDELQSLVVEATRTLGWVNDTTDRYADRVAGAEAVARWARETFGAGLVVACSMADAALPHLVAAALTSTDTPTDDQPAGPDLVDVLFLDTGYHFPETVETRDRVAAELPVRIIDVTPELTVAEQDEKFGKDLFARDPSACCAQRKVAPLAAALTAYEAWVTGVRREEAPTRANTPLVTWDSVHGLVKVNPLATWTFDDLLRYAEENEVIVNPLLQQGYPSIGCAPCTRKVAPGDDPRSGRWADFNKTECGIHQ